MLVVRHKSRPVIREALFQVSEKSEHTITHEQATQIAAEWAAVSDESVNTHIDVQRIPDGFLVELVVYYGSGPSSRSASPAR